MCNLGNANVKLQSGAGHIPYMDLGLASPLSESAVSEAAYWIHFASPDILKFHIDTNHRSSIRMWLAPGADPEEVSRKIKETIAQFAISGAEGQHGPVVEQKKRIGPDRQGRDIPFKPDDAINAGIIKPLGLADVAMGEIMVKLVHGLDRAFLSIARKFDASERSYSSLLPIDFLQECRYFDAFPQNIMYPSHLSTDIDASKEFIEATLSHEGRPPRDFQGFAERTHVLAPAACFHVYYAEQNEVLEENQAITTVGRCFRYESRNASLIERLWDFSMREIVFIGDPDYVRSRRLRSIDLVSELAENWGLSGVLEPSHDPFFLRGKRNDCEVDPLAKYELRFDLPYKSGDFACTSFNVHGTFFGSVSSISGPSGNTAWTGCTAFGLERWAWAILAQHGVDPDVWPEALRGIMEE